MVYKHHTQRTLRNLTFLCGSLLLVWKMLQDNLFMGTLFLSQNENKMSQKRADFRKLFEKSRQKMDLACSENIIIEKMKDNVPLDRFLFDPKSKLLMCKTAKHGSTTWSNHFVSIYRNG